MSDLQRQRELLDSLKIKYEDYYPANSNDTFYEEINHAITIVVVVQEGEKVLFDTPGATLHYCFDSKGKFLCIII